MKHARTIYRRLQQGLALTIILSVNLVTPLATVHAQDALDASGNPTGPGAVTGATNCTGAACYQGADQGTNQGLYQGLTNGVVAANENTGAESDNQNDVTADATTTTDIDNTATTTTDAAATANSGSNTANKNSSSTAIETGNAGIGVTQVINDNTTVLGGSAGLNVTGHSGDYNGDLNLDFGSGTADLANVTGDGSVKATNTTTGYNSTNGTDVTTTVEKINEVQNDGVINNLLELAAITGQNEASMNTGDAAITTGDADVAATLVNLLNTTVINGNLWVAIADIFGDLNGNINIPDLTAWLAAYQAQQALVVDAGNDTTGEGSTNTVNVALTDTETTAVTNDADITTTVTAEAITGQNDSLGNTGGATVDTGDATVSASNINLANTTIEGGNWGIFIVNAATGWLGFMVGDNGSVQALSQEETLQHVQAQNSNTGAESDNTINVAATKTTTDTITNDATINNEILASAITGQNETNYNTGAGQIATGDAAITATTVNVANTTVKNGSLFIAVVNIFGDWFGDLLYGGQSLAASAGNSAAVTVDASNGTTGANSTNEVNVEYDREHTTRINNDADIATTLNATIDTGSNTASKNTGAAQVTTGDGLLAMHTRTAANLVGLAASGGLGVGISGLNEVTGENSKNKITANINDDRIVAINNDANVSTVLGSANNPALVNTGNNSADMNTLGALITTGNASADVAIQNLVNQVILSLAGRGIAVDANFANELTGALSTNTADLTATQQTLIDIVNRGLIDNLINLLLNTGGNTTNKNTGGVAISTGAVCVDGVLINDVNQTTGLKKGVSGDTTVAAAGANTATGYDSTNTTAVTTNQQGNANLSNNGTINNNANIAGTTGNNEQNMNTGGPTNAPTAGECPKIALAPSPSPSVPSPSPTPGPTGGGGDDEGGGNGGGDQGPEGVGGGDAGPRVAGVTKDKQPTIAPAKGLLKRFPVAGAEGAARLLPGRMRLPWQIFIVGSMALLMLGWSLDRKHQARYLGQLP